jgi:release factor glutamine methyltransferase
MDNTPTRQEQEQEAWTIRRLLTWTTNWFRYKDVEGGRLAAELLLAHALGCAKIQLYTRIDEEPTEAQRAAFRDLVRQAGKHTPIAYLLGHREFFSLDFEVTPAVLIPRPETEALAQRMIAICRERPQETVRILDVGTGTGCVAIAIAHYAPNAQVVAADVSADSLDVAQRNIARHDLTDRVHLAQADGLQLQADTVPDGGFDAIVTNPPYISEDDWQHLPPHIRDYEPKAALVPPGGDGLGMYRAMGAEAHHVLTKAGVLLAEIGEGQLDGVRGIFEAAGDWDFVGSHRNPNDPAERVVEFHRRPCDPD